MANTASLKPFKKGDPRINKKGRPKGFTQLRQLAQQIADEVAKTKDGREVIIDNHKVTVVEAILRQWAKDPKRQQQFVEYAYGKVPQPVEMTLEQELLQLLKTKQIDPHTAAALFPDVSLPEIGIEA